MANAKQRKSGRINQKGQSRGCLPLTLNELYHNSSRISISFTSIGNVVPNDFSCAVRNVVHCRNPLHHIRRFEGFGDASFLSYFSISSPPFFRFTPLIYPLKKPFSLKKVTPFQKNDRFLLQEISVDRKNGVTYYCGNLRFY